MLVVAFLFEDFLPQAMRANDAFIVLTVHMLCYADRILGNLVPCF